MSRKKLVQKIIVLESMGLCVRVEFASSQIEPSSLSIQPVMKDDKSKLALTFCALFCCDSYPSLYALRNK